MSTALLAASLSSTNFCLNTLGSLIRPLAYMSIMSRFLSLVSNESGGASKISRRFSYRVTASRNGAFKLSPGVCLTLVISPNLVTTATSVSSTVKNS